LVNKDKLKGKLAFNGDSVLNYIKPRAFHAFSVVSFNWLWLQQPVRSTAIHN